MARRLARRATFWAALLLTVAGCAGARLVSFDAHGGCIAIPENSDGWPYYYHTSAEQIMRAKCPDGYRVLKEEKVVVGKSTTKKTRHDLKGDPLLSDLFKDAHASATDDTEVHERTEWRIWFEKKK